jgi:hypothetical protein
MAVSLARLPSPRKGEQRDAYGQGVANDGERDRYSIPIVEPSVDDMTGIIQFIKRKTHL